MNNDSVERDFQEVEAAIASEEDVAQRIAFDKEKFVQLSVDELADILSLTIKEDKTNKIITFLCCLAAFTEDSQFNISFNAPSSSGKSYIPSEEALLFPKEDVIKVGYCSPTAFFHDHGVFNKDIGGYCMDLERKIMIFLDQPHNQLLAHLRPLLSHDEKEIKIKIADKTQRYGLKTKNIIIKGYPSVIFCTAGLRIDEQEATRFLLLSPETSQDKIKQGVDVAIAKATDIEAYVEALIADPRRQLLIQRIKAIKEAGVTGIKIHASEKIRDWFHTNHKIAKPRHQRDIKRLIALVKSHALLNLWHRESRGSAIFTSDADIEAGIKLWQEISYSQELNLPPYLYKLYEEIIIPAHQDKGSGITRNDILSKHFEVYGRPLPEWQLRREMIPMLETAGLITQDQDPNDKRNKLITPIYPTIESILSSETGGSHEILP